MSYIGNARSLLIIGSNTRDDLVPQFDGQQTFTLSQDVPGGYESSITVLKQKYITYNVISNNTDISITDTDRTILDDNGNLVPRTEKCITSNDSYIAVALSKITPGDKITITLTDASPLNDTFDVIDVVYTGTTANVYIATTVTQNINDEDNLIGVTLVGGKYDDWTILEPEIDYTIGTTATTSNTLTLSKALSLNDRAYVLHKGEATYNFTPTVRSVGPEQLQENLRNFRCDRYIADGSTTFALSDTDDTSYNVVDAKSLLVSIDGQVVDSDGTDANGDPVTGAWILDAARNESGLQTITFHDAPDVGVAIRILHLGFSTVSRRAAFAPGQSTATVLPNSVGSDQLKAESVTEAKISNTSVSTLKIRDGAVTGAKILLNNADAIRGKTSSDTEQDLLKIEADNSTTISASTQVSVSINGTKTATITPTAIIPETSNISLGSDSNKFKDASFSGTVTATDVSVSGNISGTVDGVNVSTLNDTVNTIKLLIESGVLSPIGSIMIWSASTLPLNHLRCDGSSVNTYTYRELHALISNTYGGAAYQAGVTDVPGATTSFNLPDLVTRFPVGANTTGTNIGQNENVSQASRTITHTHTGASHTHTFTHTHNVPGHYHSVDVSAGSNISISSSGTHTTDIAHTHATAYNRSNGLVNANPSSVSASTLIYASGHTGTDPLGGPGTSRNKHTNPTEFPAQPLGTNYDWQDGEHLHVLNTNNMSIPHGHSVNVTDHTHSIGYRKATVASGTTATINQVASVATATSSGFFTDSAGASTLTGSAFNTDVPGRDSTSHFHPVNINRTNTSHTLGTTHYLTITGSHCHFVTIPAFTGSSPSSGTHTHSTSAFSGSIGKVTAGSNGNADITTSAMPSSDATVPAPTSEQLGTTGSSTSPHLVVNFIIKVSNTQVV